MSTENQTPETVPDIWNMSDADFAQLDLGSFDTAASEDEAATSNESEQTQPDTQEPEVVVETDEEEEVLTEEPTEEESDEVVEEESATDINYESEFKRLIGTPIKANGKEITIDSIDDAIKFIQMGANYYKKVEQLKPAQKIVSMLEKAQLLDEAKLSFAIDLLNKDPAAIQSLVSDMDMSEVLDEQHKEYVPKDRSVSDNQLNLDNAINEVLTTPHGKTTLQVLGEVWDEASRRIVAGNPSIVGLINQHVADGTYDTVTREVEKRRMLGQIPQGLNDIEAYKFVGDQLYTHSNNQAAPQGQQQGSTGVNTKPIKKPSKESVVNQRRAASNVARTNQQSVSQNLENVFEMSDADFQAKYGKV